MIKLRPRVRLAALLFVAMFALTATLTLLPNQVFAASNKSTQNKAKDYCKQYDNSRQNACEKGYLAGASNGNTPCNNYSGGKKDACKDGFSEGKDSGGENDAEKSPCDQDKCDLIKKYVNPTINLLSILFGLIATGSLILGGIQFSTSEGDPQKAAQAKDRIAGTVFAIFAYAFLYAFLQFLVPGGIFNR